MTNLSGNTQSKETRPHSVSTGLRSVEKTVRNLLANPLPPHLRGVFVSGLGSFFWPISVGGIVCTALELGLALELGGLLPLIMLAITAVGFSLAVILLYATRDGDVTELRRIERLELGFSVSTVLVGTGVGGITFLVLSGSNQTEMHLLAFGIAMATLGIANTAGASRPLVVAIEVLCIAIPSIAAFLIHFDGLSAIAGALGVTAYASISLVTSSNAYLVQVESIMARDEQRTERARLEAAMVHLPQGLVMLDRDERVVVMNEACRTLLGYDASAPLTASDFAQVMADAPNLGLKSPISRASFLERAANMRVSSQPFDTMMHLTDDRIINVQGQSIPDKGWLVVMRDTTGERAALAELNRQARRCTLSGLPNRRAFMEELDARCARLDVDASPFSLILVDLDDFKLVNDRYGHSTGDRVIAAMAQRLRTALPGLFVARLGGDEFAVLADTADVASARCVAEALANTTMQPLEMGDIVLNIQLAAGIAQVPEVAPIPFDLMRAADLALLSAKRGPARAIMVFEPRLLSEAEERSSTEVRVSAAIRGGRVDVAYQPIVDLRTRQVAGIEALARWRDDGAEPIGTDRLVSTAQNKGLLVDLRRVIVAEAVTVAARQPLPLSLWINVSALDMQSRTLAPELAEALAGAGLSPKRLVVEITETSLMTDMPAGLETMQRLRAMGVRVAMDDFGAGFSSLDRLRRLPLDELKISGSLVTGSTNDAAAASVFSAAAMLGRNMGLTVTAEGIETAEDLTMAIRAGIDCAQGYLFCHAVTADALAEAIVSAEQVISNIVTPLGGFDQRDVRFRDGRPHRQRRSLLR
jgi:diguanylate cyclase (GGDEF)-like protein